MRFDGEGLASDDQYRDIDSRGLDDLLTPMIRRAVDKLIELGTGPDEGETLAKLPIRPRDPPGSIALTPTPSRVLVNS